MKKPELSLPQVSVFPVLIPKDFEPSDYDRDGIDLGPTSKPCPGYTAPYKPSFGGGFRALRGVDQKHHRALDIMAAEGAHLVTPCDAEIVKVGFSEKGGNHVFFADSNGWTWYYAHLREPALVHVGQAVKAGHHVGYVGRTGNARRTTPKGWRGCPHLHCSLSVPEGTPAYKKIFFGGRTIDRIAEKIDILPFVQPLAMNWRVP